MQVLSIQTFLQISPEAGCRAPGGSHHGVWTTAPVFFCCARVLVHRPFSGLYGNMTHNTIRLTRGSTAKKTHTVQPIKHQPTNKPTNQHNRHETHRHNIEEYTRRRQVAALPGTQFTKTRTGKKGGKKPPPAFPTPTTPKYHAQGECRRGGDLSDRDPPFPSSLSPAPIPTALSLPRPSPPPLPSSQWAPVRSSGGYQRLSSEYERPARIHG